MICLICSQDISNQRIGTHLAQEHRLNRREYEEKFNTKVPRPQAWNRGLTTETSQILKERAERASIILRAGFQSGKYKKWQLGYTKATHPSIQKISEKLQGHTINIDPQILGRINKRRLQGKTYEELYGGEQARLLKEARSGSNNTRWKERIIKICACGCGETFAVKITAQKKKFVPYHGSRGKNNANWRNGLSTTKYGLEFNQKLRTSIKTRDLFQCQYCGKDYGKLDVHHIDYDKKNNHSTNLITLCCSCHSKTNYHRNNWTAFFKAFIYAAQKS